MSIPPGHLQTRASIIRRKRGLRKVTQQRRVREIIKLLEAKHAVRQIKVS